MSDFVHLHVHSHYSLLDGACTPKDLLSICKEYEMPAVAMTDHGYMGGTLDMYHVFSGSGIKPIVGCEMYLSPTNRFDRDPNNPDIRGYHLLLLAENNDGYHSLCKLISEAWLNGMYYKPRIDRELLAQHHKGLIALSACIGGEIQQAVLKNRPDDARRIIGDYRDLFGPENFYLEIMDHGLEEERIANKALIGFSKEFNLPIVATNDVHYLRKEHAQAHEIMLCVQTGSKLSDERRFRFSGPDYYFKSPAEMKELFKEIPEAVTNTVGVAERCGVSFKFAPDVNHYPVFNIPVPGQTEKDYLRNICLDALPKRYHFDARDGHELTEEEQVVIERLDYELSIIDRTKYCSYFLVVRDFIYYAKTQDIPVGPGRGSGAGSLVAFLTGITDIDPLRYNLLFERFLNPERVSPPDFDVDFCEDRRVEVIEYVRNKYGSESVAQICTYGTMKAKAVIKDVARVLGKTFEESDRITKLIPADPKMNLTKALKESKDLQDLYDNEEYVREVFQYALVLEGINRQLGIHAAGVIIGDQRLDNLVPLARGAQNEVITEFPALHCEQLGLLKMDFLGLRTLTTIHRAVKLVEKHRNIKIDIGDIPLDDPVTYDLLKRADTIAVFQLESGGMQDVCRRFECECIEHIIALLAIYRPGPMDFIPDFVARKRGLEVVIYDHPLMEQFLKETFGIMLYQEQIMQVVQVLAGFSLGGADILRRAIGKKKVDVLAQQKAKFVEGCWATNQIPEENANIIWDKIALFANYGFNKSHSAAYAFVSYQTAYMKANYPVEYMAAVLTAELADAEKISFLINACHQMKIDILPPSVNASDIDFSVDSGAIRFGLGAIKGVGGAAAGAIMNSREKDGKFKTFTEFCERVGDSLNSRMLEHLIRAGACDCFGLLRSQLLMIAEPTMSYAQAALKDRNKGQGSLFDLLDDGDREEIQGIPIPEIPELPEKERLKGEKELLGFYVTGHPLGSYSGLIRSVSTTGVIQQKEWPDCSAVRIGGMIKTAVKKISKKSGKPFMIVEFEDLDSTIEVMLYERALEQSRQAGVDPVPELPVVMEATVSKNEDDALPKVSVERLLPMEKVPELYAEELIVYLKESELTTSALLPELRSLCSKATGDRVPLILCVDCDRDPARERVVFIETALRFDVNLEFLKQLEALLGANCWKLKCHQRLPVPRPRGNWSKPAETQVNS